MIGQGVSEVMTFAVGVAISPLPIIALIVILLSGRATNGLAFALGWVIGLSVVSAVVYVVTDASDVATDSGASDTTSTLKVVLGALLLVFALRNWRKRGAAPSEPKWMRAIDTVTPPRAFGLALLLAAVNPKNLILTAAAAAGVSQLGLTTSASVVSIIVFVLIASTTILGPVLYLQFAGDRGKAHLNELRHWLAANNAAVMSVLFLVFGVVLISKGLGLLSI